MSRGAAQIAALLQQRKVRLDFVIDEGLLILVDATRHWFPEQVDLPSAQGLVVEIEAPNGAAEVADAGQGWSVRSR